MIGFTAVRIFCPLKIDCYSTLKRKKDRKTISLDDLNELPDI